MLVQACFRGFRQCLLIQIAIKTAAELYRLARKTCDEDKRLLWLQSHPEISGWL